MNSNKQNKQQMIGMGEGMSFLTKLQMINSIPENIIPENIIIIDPESEYKSLKNIIGGKLTPINPLELSEEKYGVYMGTPKGGVTFHAESHNRTESKNMFIFGKAGQGKAFHPWDNLKLCECGGSAWMEGKNGGDFEEGEPYRIRCRKCGKHTKYGEIPEIKNDWNSL